MSAQYTTETIGCRTKVIGAKALTILLTSQIKASTALTEWFKPAMQLSKIGKTTVSTGIVTNYFSEFFISKVLPLSHLFAKYLTYLLWSICITKVIGCITIYVIKNPITQ